MRLKIALLLVIALAAAWWDLRQRRIPNWLTLPAFIAGIGLHVTAEGTAGLSASVLGAAVGAIPFAVVYWLGGMGAGDVKLMAGVGALFAFPAAVQALFCIALAGGVLALVRISMHLYQQRAGTKTAGSVRRLELPYGIAIALGTCFTIFLGMV
ncbi:MAG TPA: A24 family peptidase [bacterium]|nr:A24 family peptidase [bacterium]